MQSVSQSVSQSASQAVENSPGLKIMYQGTFGLGDTVPNQYCQGVMSIVRVRLVYRKCCFFGAHLHDP